MTSNEVQKILGISRMTLSNYVKEGKIGIKTKLSSKHVIYDDESVYRLLKTENTKYMTIHIEKGGEKLVFTVPERIMDKIINCLKEW